MYLEVYLFACVFSASLIELEMGTPVMYVRWGKRKVNRAGDQRRLHEHDCACVILEL